MKVRLGIDLGGSFIKAGILSDTNKVLYKLQMSSGADSGAKVVINNLQQAFMNLKSYSDKKGYKILSLGIGSPGTISQPSGKVTDASPNVKGWKGTVLTKLFGNINIPVYADNDANCAALAEYLISFSKQFKNMVFITIGTGIGGGLIINGCLHRGSHYAAAEIGHTIIKYKGKLCKCGMRGCLEAYASVPNMMQRFNYWSKQYQRKTKTKISPVKLYNLYNSRNPVAVKTIKENAEYIGTGLGSVVNVLNPESVVIGGGFSHSGKEYIKLIEKSIKQNAFKSAVSKLKVFRAGLGNDAGFIGAALLVFVYKNGQIKKDRKKKA